MKFKTLGNRKDPAVLFFHAMGVTGESSEPVAKYLQDRYFCMRSRIRKVEYNESYNIRREIHP